MNISKIKSRGKIFLMTLVILITLRLIAPYVGKHYINKVLSNDINSYQGSIDDLSLSILTGSYFMSNFRIVSKANPRLPFIQIKNLYVRLSWKMLLKGHVVLNLKITNSSINFVDSKSEKEKQITVSKKEQQHWTKAIDAIIPLSLEEVVLKNLSIEFENKSLKGAEKSKILVESAETFNLIDPTDNASNLSPVKVVASVNHHSPLWVSGGIDITKNHPQINLRYELKNFKIETINKLLRYYVPIDITKGNISILAETSGDTFNLKGNARVYIDNLDIIETQQQYKSGSHFLIEWAGGLSNWLLSVLSDDRITTEIPFEIEKGQFKIDASETFFNTLKNLGEGLPYEFKKK